MNEPIRLVVFTLGEQAFALPLSQVERVVQAVETTGVSDTPETIVGVVNVQGHLLPVLDIRKRFGLPVRERELSDLFVLACTAARTVAVVAETVRGVSDYATLEELPGQPFLPGLAYVRGAVHSENETILVCDLDKLFSADEAARLNAL